MFNRKELAERLKLYLICGEGDTPEALPEKVEAALNGGVTAVQLRVKSWPARKIWSTARALTRMTRSYGVIFIVNDRLDIALSSGADGVHLGQQDIPVDAARKLAPNDFIIGATARTCGLAQEAQELGANYIGCGSAFATMTKGDAVVIGPDGIRDVLSVIDIPSVAIGGITLKNLHLLAGCGCSGISLAAGIMNSVNPGLSAAMLIKEIDKTFSRDERQLNRSGSLPALKKG